jgi:hypothetical protein
MLVMTETIRYLIQTIMILRLQRFLEEKKRGLNEKGSKTHQNPQKWGFFIGGHRGRHGFGTGRHGRENACVRKLSFCQLREYGAENVWGNVGGCGA